MDHQRLRYLIEKSKSTQKEIAASLGLSQQRFNYYATGQREPDAATLCSIADYFGVSVDYLLGRENEKKPTPVSGDGLSEEQKLWSTAWDQASPELRRAAMAVLRSGEPSPEAPGASPSDT